MHQLFWMLLFGFPLVGLIHIAMGSFLSLQAYYGSTFVDGTGAVVGVGLLRNLGGLMTGLTLAGMLAARMIPGLRFLAREGTAGGGRAVDADRDATHRPSTVSASASPTFLRGADWPRPGSPPPRSPVFSSRNGVSRSARLSAGKPLSR